MPKCPFFEYGRRVRRNAESLQSIEHDHYRVLLNQAIHNGYINAVNMSLDGCLGTTWSGSHERLSLPRKQFTGQKSMKLVPELGLSPERTLIQLNVRK